MGIPSQQKKLCDRIPGLLSKVRKGSGPAPTHLWVDFNCMVYHCLRRPGSKAQAGEETRIAWENELIRDVCQYLKKVVSLVRPTQQVFVGVDGVVPMAKMRQQRLRRFKSHWLAAEELRLGISDPKPRWDTNSITPGTAFMERLGIALKEIRTDGLRWIVSGADEPGEGEHKAMQGIRSSVQRESHVIQGLDADLIVLALLQPVKEMWLFREAVECGEVQQNSWNEEEYRQLSIHKLREVLTAGATDPESFLLDYCLGMSLVGNDFLPHGLTLKLRDGAHDMLLEMLRSHRKSHGNLVGKDGQNRAALQAIFDSLAVKEEEAIQGACGKKIGSRFQQARGTTPQEVARDEMNKTPLRLAEEMALVSSIRKGEDGKTKVTLKEDWRRIYQERWLGASLDGTDVNRICEQYLVGLDWIRNQYLGAPVSTDWCFPWFLPPLWSDLADSLRKQGLCLAPDAATTSTVLAPQEQLTLVLPLASWGLLRDKRLRQIPRQVSQLYPTSFEFFSAGHSMMWECEAQIPLFQPQRLRFLLNEEKRS